MRIALLLFPGFCAVMAGQEAKHLLIPSDKGPAVSIRANSIERDGEYPSTVRLRGAVEIKSQVCLPVGKDGKLICDGYTILRADAATFHEATGQIDAAGSVTVIPLQHEPAGKASR